MKDTHWDLVAKGSGYTCLRDLLDDWYTHKKLSIEAISNELNVHRTTITRRLQEYGIEVRSAEPFTITKHEALNFTVEQIAQKYKVTHSTAWRAKKRAKERS